MIEQKIPCPRAWHKEEEEYYEVGSISYKSKVATIITNCGRVAVHFSKLILEWPTGRPDKTGKMIHQGDVVAVHQFLFDGTEVEEEHVGVITYKEDDAAFHLDKIKGDFWEEYTGLKRFEESAPLCNFYGLHEESFEIIGNINKNPNY